MKWKIVRILIILAAVFQFQLIGFLNPMVTEVKATSNADVVIYFWPTGGVIPPSGFTAVYIDDYTVKLDWSKVASSNNTMIRAKDNGYPTSITDGYLVYLSTAVTTNDTAVDYYNFLGKKYYAAWTDNRTNDDDPNWEWSSIPAIAELESPVVTDLVVQVEAFNRLVNTFNGLMGQFNTSISAIAAQYLLAILIIIIAALAFWHRDRFLYILAGFVLIIYGFSLWTTSTYLSIILVLIGVYNFIKAKWGGKERRA